MWAVMMCLEEMELTPALRRSRTLLKNITGFLLRADNMHKVPLPCLLRTVRLLQSCHCPSLLRTWSSRSGLLLLHEIRPRNPASVPIRFLNQESAEDKSPLSVNRTSSRSDESRDESSLNTYLGHSEDGEKSSLQSASIRLPKKMTCNDLLDAFSSDSHSQQQIYSTLMYMWRILSAPKKFQLSDTQLIADHPNFFNLCYEVMTVAHSMSNMFLVCSLEVFVRLNVNQKTRLIQTLLSLCQQRLSTLKGEETYILVSTLKMMESNKNVDLLKSGLCLLIELKCDAITDVRTLQNLMRIAPAHLTKKYEERALRMADHFTVGQCCNMFSVLAEINLYSESLLDTCSQKIIDCLDDLSCKRILHLTDHCVKLFYLKEALLSAVGDCIVSNIYMWHTLQISSVLKNMALLRFRHVPLLDCFADKLMQESESLRMNYLVSAAIVFSVLNHLPEGKEDKFLETLRNGLNLHMDSMDRKLLLRTVYNLCSLGLVYPPTINKLLEEQNPSIMKNTEKAYMNHIERCLLLELGQHPVSIRDLVKVHKDLPHSVMQCHTFLKNYFKDPTLYQENILFPSSYFIDFVLTLDRDQSKLVPILDLQNFESSEDVTPIAVLCCTANAFTLGSDHPIGKVALKIRQIKSLGFIVVLIHVHKFMMMSDASKDEFLRENIFKDVSSIQS